MTSKIIFTIALLAFAMIASQAFMYMLSLKQVQLNLGANSYIEIRKLIDISMRASFKYVIYVALLANVLLIIVTAKTPTSLVFISATIALVALVAEIVLTLKGNLPINDIINTWSVDNYPANWITLRDKWFTIFQYRQIASITGFVSLLIGAVFGRS
jgi:phosphate starvation-inducible membrane PsiE